MSHAVSPYSDFVLTGPRKTVKTKAKIKKRGGFTRRTPRQRDDDTMSTTSEHTTPTPTPKRSSGKKTKAKELGRRFLQLDKVELPSKKGKGNG